VVSETTMLQQVANVIIGAITLTLAGCMLGAHLISGEPLQGAVLVLAAVLLTGAAACLRAGLVAGDEGPGNVPALPSAGEMAAWRLRELKRAGAQPHSRRLRWRVEAPPHPSIRA
jgi:hypothetical protein